MAFVNRAWRQGAGVEAISAGLLVAMATGAAGAAGQQLWAALTDLLRRQPRAGTAAGADPLPTGEAELAALSEASHDIERARALSEAMRQRAAHDAQFRSGLIQWQRSAEALRPADGAVTNTISGGNQKGPVLQGRDFFGVTFTDRGEGE
ncbi:hypothetical protein IF655_01040 [Streptomyces sp. DSM 110735]|uniref:hypothetical protein n=1 Tax=Streptomyces sp. DSM 110735 TaxID=2775031 RepID=UPI0018F2A0E7|nr:hypothetical protein [Streptomyces sp. DSM 110735]MBJ7901887.1 hypothetical protein [Streptomyces sp. DSM 110735]